MQNSTPTDAGPRRRSKRPSEAPARRGRSVDYAAERLGVSRRTVYNLINDGELDSYKVRGRRVVDDDRIEALVVGKRGRPS